MANRTFYNPDAEYSNWHSGLNDYYAKLFEQYGNTRYWSEFMANPYLNVVFDPKHPNNDYWADWRIESYPKAFDYVSKLLQRINNTDYDSASEQVMREREAGINPDLAGNVTAGGAADPALAEMGQQPSMREYDVQKTAIADTVINDGLTMLQGVVGLLGGVADVQGQNINNSIGAAAAADATDELFWTRLIDASPSPDFGDGSMSEEQRFDAMRKSLQVGFNTLDWNGIPRSYRRSYQKGFENWMRGAKDSFGFEKRLMDHWKAYTSDKKQVVSTVGDGLWKDNLGEMVAHYYDILGDLATKLQEAEARASELEAQLRQQQAGLSFDINQGLIDDPNYVPSVQENMKANPQVVAQQQQAQIASAQSTVARSGAEIEQSGADTLDAMIQKEQKKFVNQVGDIFDKAIERVNHQKRFRKFIPYERGAIKFLKVHTMSVLDKRYRTNPTSTNGQGKLLDKVITAVAGM